MRDRAESTQALARLVRPLRRVALPLSLGLLPAAALTVSALSLPVLSSPAAAQDFPVDFLRMMAMRSQPPAQALPAMQRYAEAAEWPVERRSGVLEALARARTALESGDEAAAHRALAEARALADGLAWTPRQAFASSIEVRAPGPLLESGQTAEVAAARLYPAEPVTATLRVSAQAPGGAPQVLAEAPLRLRGDRPQAVRVPVPQTLQGRANLVSEVVIDGEVMARSSERIDFVPDLARLEREAEAVLARTRPSEDAAAVVRYPFALAKALRSGEREQEARAFSHRLARSAEVLEGLEQGRDIVWRATGDQHRAHRFPETGELIPYRIYVPTTWDGQASLPVIVALHGGGGDENGMLDGEGGKFGPLAERYGYIVVSPLGYRPTGAYGSPIRLPSVYGSTTQEGRDVGGPERAQLLARSERDVLEVLERTIVEYGADRSRVYLTGHSMGGGGTWYLAHQHPHLWDAIAASAGPFFIDDYDFERLRDMGVMIVQGSGDPPSLEPDRKLAIDLLKLGIGVNYLETPSVNHGQTFGNSLPSIFEFFERQKLRDNPGVPLPLR